MQRLMCILSFGHIGAVWVKNLEQKINLRLKPPTDEEIVKLGGKSLEK